MSVAEARRRKVKCRECGQEVARGAGSCPACGFTEPAATPIRWGRLIALALILGSAGSAAVWKLGFLDRRPVDSSVADSAAIDRALQKVAPRWRKDPPRIRSARFNGSCLTPAPVLVYDLDVTPSMFFIRLSRDVPDPRRTTDSLVKRYELHGAGYDIKRSGVLVWKVSPAVVAGLRCEPTVISLDEVSH